MRGSLAGEVAIVTGAAGGIGTAIARRLAAEGAHVVGTDRTDGQTVTADLADPAGAEKVVAAAIERYGRLDILVNNAGGGIIKPFLDHTLDTMRETVDRNLWTTVYCCRAALPHMLRAQYGRIVNIGADSVRNGLFDHAMYNAAKGGVHALTTGLAREFAPHGITVNTVAPTGTATPTVLSRPPDAVERYRKTTELIPLGRFATVEEVASAVAYLAADESRFITGQVISVNGGTAML